jgi:F1F0 ATPase subunit 2
MGAERMSAAGLGTCFAAGMLAGWLYFRSLWWTTRRFAARGNVVATAALTLGRMALLGGGLGLAARQGALALLLVAFGVLAARDVVMRRMRAAVP